MLLFILLLLCVSGIQPAFYPADMKTLKDNHDQVFVGAYKSFTHSMELALLSHLRRGDQAGYGLFTTMIQSAIAQMGRSNLYFIPDLDGYMKGYKNDPQFACARRLHKFYTAASEKMMAETALIEKQTGPDAKNYKELDVKHQVGKYLKMSVGINKMILKTAVLRQDFTPEVKSFAKYMKAPKMFKGLGSTAAFGKVFNAGKFLSMKILAKAGVPLLDIVTLGLSINDIVQGIKEGNTKKIVGGCIGTVGSLVGIGFFLYTIATASTVAGPIGLAVGFVFLAAGLLVSWLWPSPPQPSLADQVHEQLMNELNKFKELSLEELRPMYDFLAESKKVSANDVFLSNQAAAVYSSYERSTTRDIPMTFNQQNRCPRNARKRARASSVRNCGYTRESLSPDAQKVTSLGTDFIGLSRPDSTYKGANILMYDDDVSKFKYGIVALKGVNIDLQDDPPAKSNHIVIGDHYGVKEGQKFTIRTGAGDDSLNLDGLVRGPIPVCPMKNGNCQIEGHDQPPVRLNSVDSASSDAKASCLAACFAYGGTYACEIRWDQKGREGCYAYKATAGSVSSDNSNKAGCWAIHHCSHYPPLDCPMKQGKCRRFQSSGTPTAVKLHDIYTDNSDTQDACLRACRQYTFDQSLSHPGGCELRTTGSKGCYVIHDVVDNEADGTAGYKCWKLARCSLVAKQKPGILDVDLGGGKNTLNLMGNSRERYHNGETSVQGNVYEYMEFHSHTGYLLMKVNAITDERKDGLEIGHVKGVNVLVTSPNTDVVYFENHDGPDDFSEGQVTNIFDKYDMDHFTVIQMYGINTYVLRLTDIPKDKRREFTIIDTAVDDSESNPNAIPGHYPYPPYLYIEYEGDEGITSDDQMRSRLVFKEFMVSIYRENNNEIKEMIRIYIKSSRWPEVKVITPNSYHQALMNEAKHAEYDKEGEMWEDARFSPILAEMYPVHIPRGINITLKGTTPRGTAESDYFQLSCEDQDGFRNPFSAAGNTKIYMEGGVDYVCLPRHFLDKCVNDNNDPEEKFLMKIKKGGDLVFYFKKDTANGPAVIPDKQGTLVIKNAEKLINEYGQTLITFSENNYDIGKDIDAMAVYILQTRRHMGFKDDDEECTGDNCTSENINREIEDDEADPTVKEVIDEAGDDINKVCEILETKGGKDGAPLLPRE